MKLTYVLAAILVCNLIAAFAGGRTARTALSLVSAALAGYGLFRLIG
ncbi:hypothetical protein [Caldimonas caldifontis]|jgi:hypothetical protein|nr:hypothetical protein [Caldimonas caldifontis]